MRRRVGRETSRSWYEKVFPISLAKRLKFNNYVFLLRFVVTSTKISHL